MIASTDAMIRHIHGRWHEAVVNRDLDGLMALYKEDACFESPLVFATLKDQSTGILTGKAAIGFDDPGCAAVKKFRNRHRPEAWPQRNQ